MLIIWLLETQLRTGLPAILTAQKQESGEKGMGYNDQLACYGSVPLIYGEGKTQRFSLYREVQLLGPEWEKKPIYAWQPADATDSTAPVVGPKIRNSVLEVYLPLCFYM